MLSWFNQLDDLLRGRKTSPNRLVEGSVELPLRTFVPLAVILGLAYGFFMGWYAISSRDPICYEQLIASMVKLPALFLLTLAVTFPSLYVFNALVSCRLSFVSTLRLLVGAVVVTLAVAASLGPILGFFTLSTTSYSFMVLLNVVLLTIAGFVGLAFLLHTLRRLAFSPLNIRPLEPPVENEQENVANETPKPSGEPGPLDRIRPFVGSPTMPVTFLREEPFSNAYVVVAHLIFGSW